MESFLAWCSPTRPFQGEIYYNASGDPEFCQPGLGQVQVPFCAGPRQCCIWPGMGNRPPNGKAVRKEIILQEKLVLKPKKGGKGTRREHGLTTAWENPVSTANVYRAPDKGSFIAVHYHARFSGRLCLHSRVKGTTAGEASTL